MKGFVKITRETLLDLAINDPNVLIVLSIAAARAQHKDNPVNGLKAGEAYLGYTDVPFSRDKYRGTMTRLVRYGLGTIKTTNKGTIISLQGCGFADYTNTEIPIENPIESPSNPHPTPTNEDIRYKIKDKSKAAKPPSRASSAEKKPDNQTTVIAYFAELGRAATMAREFCDHYASNGWVVGKARTPMKDWKAAVRGWISRQKQFGNDAKLPPEKQPEPQIDTWYDPDGKEIVTDLIGGIKL